MPPTISEESEDETAEEEEKKIASSIILLCDYIKLQETYNLESIYLNNCNLVDIEVCKLIDTVIQTAN